MKRTLEVLVNAASWPNGVVPSPILSAKGPRSASTLLALIFTARCTRPPTATGFHLSDFWAWFRYGFAFDGGPGLRLRPEWDLVDAHQKTVLSDELGVGFTTHFLAEKFGCREFADAVYTVNVLKPGMFSLGKSATRGPRKAPDYIATDGAKKFWIIECKGTQTSRQKLDDQMKAGFAQKNNVTAAAHVAIAHSLVAGLFIPQSKNIETACIKLADPTWAELDRVIRETPREQVHEAVVQVSLAKELALCGLVQPAQTLAGSPIRNVRGLTTEARQSTRRRLARPAGEAVFDSDDLWRRAGERPVSIGRIRFYATPPEQILERLSTSTDISTDIRQLAETSQNRDWEMSSNDSSATVTTPLGFRFRLAID